eukprot:jgi/Botrbrau1/9829/Bobra.0313s0008.1
MDQSSKLGKNLPIAHPVEGSSDEYESADEKTQESPGSGKPGKALNVTASGGTPTGEDDGMSTAGKASTSGNLEDELLRIKNLATGKEIAVEKRFTIRDLSTGQVFILDGEPSAGSTAAVERPISPGLVTDVSSGRAMSLEEFDRTLGLHTALEATKRAHLNGSYRRSGVSDAGSLEDGRGLGSEAGEDPGAPEGKKKGGKSWLKSKFNAAKQKLADAMRTSGDLGNDSDDSSVSRSGSSKLSMQRESLGDVTGPSPSGNLGQSVKVHVHLKLYKELTDLFLIQELHSHTGVVWAMKFSKNGRYLATGGQDCAIHVWEVILNRGQGSEEGGSAASSPTSTSNGLMSDDEAASRSMAGGSGAGTREACPVFRQTPFRTYSAHKQDVLDVSWSASQFLLSASMDKTVRLWHISMDDCLRVFKHPDFVTSLDFHPVDDKVFLSGAIDGKVRVWSIPEQKVMHWEDCHEMVTAVTFSPGGQRAVVGTMKGKCRFYNVEPGFRLEYEAQIDVKNRRGQQSRGRKVTGMAFLPGDPSKLLITSNDSRIRLYETYSMIMKYKGYHNRSTQIRASFSANGAFVVSGSDDGWVYIWSTGGNLQGRQNSKREKSSSYECFHAHDDIVTVAMFAPETAWRATRLKGPTTVPKLTGMAEQLNRLGMLGKFSREEAIHAAAAGEDALCARRAYGQVIVTAGYSGGIKVFENLGTPHWL